MCGENIGFIKTSFKHLGLVSVSFRGYAPEEILSEMKRANLSRIEWGSDVHAPKDDPEALEKLVRLQEAYGIKCCSYGTYFRLGVTPIEELLSYINAAKILGTHILRLWCGDQDSEGYSQTQREGLFAVCRQAAAIAEEQQVILCMECHNGTFTNTKESALELMRAVNSVHFRMYWQPNQFRTEEENMAYAKLLADDTEHIHVFNWSGSEKYPLKKGTEQWMKYLTQFSSVNCLLLEFMPDGRLESLAEEAEALVQIADLMCQDRGGEG